MPTWASTSLTAAATDASSATSRVTGRMSRAGSSVSARRPGSRHPARTVQPSGGEAAGGHDAQPARRSGDQCGAHGAHAAPAPAGPPGTADPGTGGTRLHGPRRGRVGAMSRGDHAELAAALRQWRERLTPADAGLPAGPRRRTPGLRREEVARLAGVSVDYVVRLEQARGPHPSESVLGALARALRLSAPETRPPLRPRRRRASRRRPGRRRRPAQRAAPARPHGTTCPPCSSTPAARLLAWNPLLEALLRRSLRDPPRPAQHALDALRARGRRGPLAGGRRGRARASASTGSRWRRPGRRSGATPATTSCAGSSTSSSGRAPGSPSCGRSARWRTAGVDRKSFEVPGVGRITLDCDSLEVPGDDQRLVVYSAAPGTRDAELLDLLRVVGLQTV